MMEKWGNWQVFVIGLGLLFIVLAPQTSTPMVMIIGGLVVVLMGVIILKKAMKKERRKNGKW